MKLFECIVDIGGELFREFSTGKNKKNMLEVYGGNGTFEKITDVTSEYLCEGSVEKLDEDLRRMNWGDAERAIITALVEEHIQNRR